MNIHWEFFEKYEKDMVINSKKKQNRNAKIGLEVPKEKSRQGSEIQKIKQSITVNEDVAIADEREIKEMQRWQTGLRFKVCEHQKLKD